MYMRVGKCVVENHDLKTVSQKAYAHHTSMYCNNFSPVFQSSVKLPSCTTHSNLSRGMSAIILKKPSCRQSSIQADIKAWTSQLEMAKLNFWGPFSGWGLGTRLGVVFDKRLIGYSSLVLSPLLTQWGSIMKVRTDSKLTGMLLSVLIVTVVMHFRE